MKHLFLWLLAGSIVDNGLAQTVPFVGHLQVEHLNNPLGIDEGEPRLAWQCNGVEQFNYALAVGTDSAGVASGKITDWWMEKSAGKEQLVRYSGPALQPFTRYYWMVAVWNKSGREVRSGVASFETGMMDQSNWKGSWVTDTKDIRLKPAAYFRHGFRVDKKIVSARVYIAVAGLYELSINGKRVGDHVLDPMYTRFDRRNLYVTYDVTDFVLTGENAIGVLLGNGWYNLQSTAVWYFDKAPWRGRPAFCLDLRITYSDGSVETISSGKDWRTALSPVVFNSIYTGEHVDDRITVRGSAGTMLRLKHGERLYPDGHVDQSNIDVHYRPTDDSDPFQTDIYILKGEGEESFQPRFNYKGFQYVEVTSSQPVELDRGSLVGYFMHSDVRPVGWVHSSNPTINKIWEATNNSYLSNLFGYPTDCPQREKNGWTGDAQIAIETGLYNFDAITVYEKWLADLRDEQQPNGVLPSIVPSDGWGYEWGNGPDWTSAIAIIPWNVYLFYGDTTLLAACYDDIKRYVDHIDLLYPCGVTTWGLGDWIPVRSRTPVPFTSTCYYYADVVIQAKTAALLHKTADAKIYTALANKIRSAFNAQYLDKNTGNYDQGFETELSAALYSHLVPAEYIPKTATRLAERVRADSIRLDVGLLGTKTILNALSENGYADLAYRLATNTTEPSWGWWIVNGATTLYENWPIHPKSDISLNHIMFGEISAWFYKGLGGIYPDTAQPGFRHIWLRPNIVAGLDNFTAIHESPYGMIRSEWTHVDGQLVYTATIPAGSSATLRLVGPGEAEEQYFELQAGEWRFRYSKGHIQTE